jgi:hypothetical protein
VGTTTERLYGRLPELYRDDDISDGDYPLLRYASLWMDQASDVEAVLDAVRDGMGNPAAADVTWLPWLAQMVGLDYSFDPAELAAVVDEDDILPTPNISVTELRATIANASAGWRVGTRVAVTAAAQTQLTGDRRVWIYTHSTGEPAGLGSGTPWDVLIVTKPDETPSVESMLDALERLQARPAGVRFWHRQYEASWTKITTAHPTWNAIEALGSWQALEETGIND